MRQMLQARKAQIITNYKQLMKQTVKILTFQNPETLSYESMRKRPVLYIKSMNDLIRKHLNGVPFNLILTLSALALIFLFLFKQRAKRRIKEQRQMQIELKEAIEDFERQDYDKMIEELEKSRNASSGLLEEYRNFQCLISGKVMKSPVSLPCSHTFERRIIKESLKKNRQCPICHQEAYMEDLRQLRTLRDCIDIFKHKILTKWKKLKEQKSINENIPENKEEEE